MCLLYAAEWGRWIYCIELMEEGRLANLGSVSVGEQPQVISFGVYFLHTLSTSAECFGNFLEPDPEKALSFLSV